MPTKTARAIQSRTVEDAPVGAETCLHCGLRVPGERRKNGSDFCCEGCARVFELIHGCGLERFYDLKNSRTAPPADLRPDSFAWLDRLLADAAPTEDGTFRLTLDVQGIHCAACVWLLQELLEQSAGGVDLKINPSIGKADLVWNPADGDVHDFLREAERFGYRFGPSRKVSSALSRELLTRLGICVASALNAMIFSLCFYFGLGPEDGLLYPFFGWLNFGLGTLSLIVGGWVFVRGAWRALCRGMVHLDLPIALGVILAYGGSVYGHLRGGPDSAYFDSVTIFIALMVVGRWMQERLLERNRMALLAGDSLQGLTTRRVRDEQVDSVAVTDVDTGDELWIVPGDLVPVDGILLERDARVSLDWINGESAPRSLSPGARVQAGSFNAGDATMRVTALQPFADSRLDDLLRGVVDLDRRTKTSARWWHRVGTIYVFAVLALALTALLVWLPRGWDRALQVTVSLLVVTCPCALGLATPLAHDLVHAALRRRGVFLRSPTFLDRALGLRKILFDKTGTLTRARLALTADSRAALAALPAEERSVLHEMVVRSNHPVSRALARELGEGVRLGVRLVESEPVRETAGDGLDWQRRDGVRKLGRAEFAAAGPAGTGRVAAQAQRSTLYARAGEVLAAFDFEEELREDATRVIAALRSEGYEIHLLSGDAPERARSAAARLGIPADNARGGLSPEAKAAEVRRLDDEDTLMIGDGLNDGLSFEAAACAGTPAVDQAALPARADFYFLGGGIDAVRNALTLARLLRRVVRDNLIVASIYNLLAIGLCLAGLVSPVVAAVLMPISSAGVVLLTANRLTERRLQWK